MQQTTNETEDYLSDRFIVESNAGGESKARTKKHEPVPVLGKRARTKQLLELMVLRDNFFFYNII